MKEIKLKNYSYRCTCGYEVNVFLDCGLPQDACTCRACGASVQRKES